MLEKLRPELPEITVAQIGATLADARDTMRLINDTAQEGTRTLASMRVTLHGINDVANVHASAMRQVEFAAIVVGGALLGLLLGVALVGRKRRAA